MREVDWATPLLRAKQLLLDYPRGIATSGLLFAAAAATAAVGVRNYWFECLPGDGVYCLGETYRGVLAILTMSGLPPDADMLPAGAWVAQSFLLAGMLWLAACALLRPTQAAVSAALAIRTRAPQVVAFDDLFGFESALELACQHTTAVFAVRLDAEMRRVLVRRRVPFVAADSPGFAKALRSGLGRSSRSWLLGTDAAGNRRLAEASLGTAMGNGASALRAIALRVEGFWLRRQFHDDLVAGRLPVRDGYALRLVSAAAARARIAVHQCAPNFAFDPVSLGITDYCVVGTSDTALETLLLLARVAPGRYVGSPRITLAGPSAQRALDELLRHAPMLSAFVSLHAVELGVQFPESARELTAALDRAARSPAIVYICLDDADAALAWQASFVRSYLQGGRIPPVVHRAAPLLDRRGNPGSEGGGVGATAAPSSDLLAGDTLDAIPRQIHEGYLALQLAGGAMLGERAALRPWQVLPFDFQEENRAQAEHLFVKLRDLFAITGAPAAPSATARRAEPAAPEARPANPAAAVTLTITPEEIEWLGEVEHRRWTISRCTLGWQYAAVRDDARQLHPLLVPWEQLDAAARQMDFDAMRAMPELLESLELQSRRLTPRLVRLARVDAAGGARTVAAVETALRHAAAALPDSLLIVVIDGPQLFAAARVAAMAGPCLVGIALTADTVAGDVAEGWSDLGAAADPLWCAVRALGVDAVELAAATGWPLIEECSAEWPA